MTALMAGVRKSSSKILAPEAETASKATAATDNISLESFVCESSHGGEKTGGLEISEISTKIPQNLRFAE